MSKEENEEGRVEVLPVQWRKHLTLEVCTTCMHITAPHLIRILHYVCIHDMVSHLA